MPWSRLLRRSVRFLAASAVLLLASIGFTLVTGGAFGLIIWGGVVVVAGIWNAWVTFNWIRSWRAVSPRSAPLLVAAVASGAVTVAWTVLVPGLFGSLKSLLLGAYILAVAESSLVLATSGWRSRRDFAIPLYNIAGSLFLASWASQEVGVDVASLGGLFLHALTRDVALFQTFTFNLLAIFVPIFLFPPLLSKPKALAFGPRAAVVVPMYVSPFLASHRSLDLVARAFSRLIGFWSAYVVVALIAFAPLAFASLGGFYALPPASSAKYRIDTNVSFAIVLGSLTDVRSAPADYQLIIDREVHLAAALRVHYVRFDIKTELLNSTDGLAALDWAVVRLRGQGFGLILSPFGADSWLANHPSFAELNRTLHDESVFLASRYQPEWLFPFYEPNGQVQLNLGHAMPTSVWMGAIEATARDARAATPTTRILIEISDGAQGPELFEAVAKSVAPIDAVGFDLYATSVSDLDKVNAYDAIHRQNPGKAFWISEFGMETIQFGQEAQARYVAAVVERSTTQWTVRGLCLWALEDNTGVGMSPFLTSGLGVTTYDGYVKPGFIAYQTAIAAVRGIPTPS